MGMILSFQPRRTGRKQIASGQPTTPSIIIFPGIRREPLPEIASNALRIKDARTPRRPQ